ncbi:MAG TPA: c-type cytochrome [Bryobacteraceae bacterium]|nr:c-type cytochrome [Bryobacteraceae bacterium]
MRLFLTMLLLLPLCAQPPQEGGKKGAPPTPKNLKILKPEDIRTAMRSYTVALGQGCNFCHVQDRSSDENPKKETARHMIEMTQHLNQQFNAAMNDSKEYVTCYTCHRGANQPLTAPPATPPAGGN